VARRAEALAKKKGTPFGASQVRRLRQPPSIHGEADLVTLAHFHSHNARVTPSSNEDVVTFEPAGTAASCVSREMKYTVVQSALSQVALLDGRQPWVRAKAYVGAVKNSTASLMRLK